MGQHEVNVGARVKGRDGKKLGTVEQLIVHPGTYRIDGFILGKGILSEPKIVEADLVTATDKEGIVLSMNRDEASELPTLIVQQLVRGGGAFSYGYGYGQPGMHAGADQWRLQGPSGGQLPNTGSESWIFQAPIGNAATENISNIGRDVVTISEKTEVIGSDGEKVGNVDEIFVEERHITGVLVRAGRVLHHDVRVPRSMFAGLTHLRIRLNVTAEEAARQSKGGQ
jgi:uncharacterized protein YrrD